MKKNISNVKISTEDKERFKAHAKSLNMTLIEYVTLCCDKYERLKINPKINVTNEQLRDIFVSFMRTQEKEYHEVNRKNIRHLVKENDKNIFIMDEILHNLKIIKTKK